MKKKKLISAIILFGLALSSCKGCDKDKDKDKNQDKNKHDILDRNTSDDSAMLKKYEELTKVFPDARVKEILEKASKALKHATGVLNGSISANKAAFNTAKDFTTSVAADNTAASLRRLATSLTVTAVDATPDAFDTASRAVTFAAHSRSNSANVALDAIFYAEYVVAKVANTSLDNLSLAARIPDFTLADAKVSAAPDPNYAKIIAANDTPSFARTIYTDANSDTKDLLKKLNELEGLFKSWSSQRP